MAAAATVKSNKATITKVGQNRHRPPKLAALMDVPLAAVGPFTCLGRRVSHIVCNVYCSFSAASTENLPGPYLDKSVRDDGFGEQ